MLSGESLFWLHLSGAGLASLAVFAIFTFLDARFRKVH